MAAAQGVAPGRQGVSEVEVLRHDGDAVVVFGQIRPSR